MARLHNKTTSKKLNGVSKSAAVVGADALVKEIAHLSAEDYAARITASWRQAVTSIIETGKLLIAAKTSLKHGEFGNMVEELPFTARTAQRLMAIAEHPVLSNATHVSDLPASWGTLYALSLLPDEELEAMLANGTIHAGIERAEVEAIAARIAKQGVFLFARLVEAMRLLDTWREKWEPDKLAKRLIDFRSSNDESMPNDFGELPSWFAALCAAYERESQRDQKKWEKWELELERDRKNGERA
jgi:hypothetical protein